MTWGDLAAAVTGAAAPRPRSIPQYPTTHWHRPNHLLAVDALDEFYGFGGDMIPPTRAEAMSVPAMARARHMVCTAGRLPLSVDPSDYPAQSLILQPDPARTRSAVHTDTLDSLLFHGAAVWRVTGRYAADDRPRTAEFVNLARVTRQDDTWLVDERPVPARDLLWFEGPHEGVLAFGGRALRAAVRLDRAYASTATNPAVATELHQTSGDPMLPDEIAALVDAARTAISSRGILFTNEAVELRTHTADAENLLISGRNAAAVEIARVVGLPATVIDAYPPGASANYSNVQARLREARDVGVDAYASAVTDRLSMDDILPRGVTCAYVWEALLRDDFKDRMDGYAAAQAAGVYTAEECRALERRAGPREEVPA